MRAEFRDKRTAGRGALVLAAMLSLFSILGGCGRSDIRPNLVLIGIDTLRADHLRCYGYSGIETPGIDELAREGVRVENAVSHVPITLPAFSSIMTSTLPPTTGVHDNAGFHLDDSALTLAEILKSEGYVTVAVVGAVVLDSANGLAQGFDRYDDNFESKFTGYQVYVKNTRPLVTDTQRRAEEVTRIALARIDSMGVKGPFFLFVHYFDPHTPYDPPPPYNDVDPSVDRSSYQYQRLLYDGEIAYTDREVGRLIRGLEDRGLRKNTLVVLTADHGESLGEHGEKTHAYFAYESTLHVPMIFSMPRRLPEGEVYRGLAGHIDILPTVLDILGVHWKDRYRLQGKSLYPFDRTNGREFSYFECAVPYFVLGCSAVRGIRSPEWKYIGTPREELYHLTEDPGEQNNLVERRRALADSLRDELGRLVSTVDIYQGAGGEISLGGRRPGEGAYREKLLALGYLGSSPDPGTGYESMFDPEREDPKDGIDEFNARLAVRARINVAGLHLKASEFDECLGVLDGLRDIGEREWVVHYYRGIAYLGKRDMERAGGELRASLETAPIGPERVRMRELLDYIERSAGEVGRQEGR